MALGKQGLVEAVGREASLAGCQMMQKQAHLAVSTVLDSIEDSLVLGRTVRFIDLFTLKPRDEKARTIASPDGDRVEIPARRGIRFRIARKLREKMTTRWNLARKGAY